MREVEGRRGGEGREVGGRWKRGGKGGGERGLSQTGIYSSIIAFNFCMKWCFIKQIL